MEDHRFDHLARAFAYRTTRRLAVGSAALAIGVSELQAAILRAEAAGTSDCQGLDPTEFINKHHCGNTHCGSNPGSDCVCVQTPGHHVRCAASFNPNADCPRTDECSDRRPCGRGRFCAKVFACCNDRPRRVCLHPCPD